MQLVLQGSAWPGDYFGVHETAALFNNLLLLLFIISRLKLDLSINATKRLFLAFFYFILDVQHSIAFELLLVITICS